jgi:Cu2+-exporting ATPase
MIGDGANDGPAFQAARVGIGLRGGAEQLLSVSDAYIQSGSIPDLLRLLNAAYRVRTRLHLSYTFAVAYNLAAGAAAVFGLISPLLAAILMPLSSLTVMTLAFLAKPYSDEHITHK